MRRILLAPFKASPPPIHGKRNGALDGVRGVASLSVLIFHLMVRGYPCAFPAPLQWWVESGWMGVDLFFVLSGYLITGVLYETKGQPHYFRNFYARRALRIFPVHFLLLVTAYLIYPWLTNGRGPVKGLEDHWPAAFLYLGNFPIAFYKLWNVRNGINQIWSVAIEEQFYVVWAVVVWLCPSKRLRYMALFFCLLSFALRLALTPSYYSPAQVYFLTFTRLDALAAGSFVALVRREGFLGEWARPVLWSLLVVSAAVTLVVVLIPGSMLDHHLPMTHYGFLSIACLFASVLYFIEENPKSLLSRFLSLAGLRWYGHNSYSVYLLQMPLIVAYENSAGAGLFTRWSSSGLLDGVVLFCLVSAVGQLSYLCVERPLLKLKRHFAYRSTATAGGPLAPS